jgi:hypothetical protein
MPETTRYCGSFSLTPNQRFTILPATIIAARVPAYPLGEDGNLDPNPFFEMASIQFYWREVQNADTQTFYIHLIFFSSDYPSDSLRD